MVIQAAQAFVVRRDRKPLTKETVETTYHFHVSLKLGDSFRDKDGINHLPSSEWAMQHIYGLFGFEFHLELSTRPENYLGEIETWNIAKIDITIRDVLRRSFQCATIQLDFQLPERFNLRYLSSDESVMPRPVIIHRGGGGGVEAAIAWVEPPFSKVMLVELG